jgi:hypothetical protein
MSSEFFKDADGVGKTLGNKLMRQVPDANDFRTVVYDTPDGQVMLKTKGGNPELTMKREQKAEAVVSECIASPLVEIAFKHGTPAEPVNPDRNPFTLTTGYRTWYGEQDPGVVGSPATVAEVQYSSDGLLYMEMRKPKKLRFLDKNNRTVDVVLARKPATEQDADNAEYDATNTFKVVAKAVATAAGAVSKFIFAEGRYRYREWYKPRSANVDWCLPVNTSAVRFLIRGLKRLRLLVWDSTKPAGQEKEVDWFFADPSVPDMAGSMPDTACANQNGREVSFSNRQFFAEKGHLREARFRVGYENANGGSVDFRLEFKRPGGFITPVDPEAVVSRTGSHPGAASSPDATEIVAFGNPYHGLMWVDGPGFSNRVLYKDSTKTSQWPWTPLEPSWGMNPFGIVEFEHQYYNVFGVKNTLDVKDVVAVEGSDEKYLKDAFLFHGAWYVREAAALGWGQLDITYGNFVQSPPIYEFLYKDDSGVVWVVRAQWSRSIPSYVLESGKAKYTSNIGLTVTLHQRYGNIAENFASPKVTTRTLFSGVVPIIWFEYVTGANLLPCATNFDNAKGALLYFRNDNFEVPASVVAAITITLSGSGATVAGEGVSVGDGITIDCVSETVQKNDFYTQYDGGAYAMNQVLDMYVENGAVKKLYAVTYHYQTLAGSVQDTYTTIKLTLDGDVLHTMMRHQNMVPDPNPPYGNYITTVTYYVDGVQHSVPSNQPNSIVVRPVFSVPEWRISGDRYGSYPNGFSPVAWTITIRPGIGTYEVSSNLPVKIVYRKSILSSTASEVGVYKYNGDDYSASIGWAYDYRTGELIKTPFGAYAYFV